MRVPCLVEALSYSLRQRCGVLARKSRSCSKLSGAYPPHSLPASRLPFSARQVIAKLEPLLIAQYNQVHCGHLHLRSGQMCKHVFVLVPG